MQWNYSELISLIWLDVFSTIQIGKNSSVQGTQLQIGLLEMLAPYLI